MNLDPGRELDALVAEKVMGISNSELKYHYGFSSYHYSTDITAAWQVIGKIKSMQFSKRHLFIDECARLVSCELGFTGSDRVHHSEVLMHITLRMICLAALKTVGL